MIKLGNIELDLDKKQFIALIAGIILIFGAAGGYWFYGKNVDTFEEASVDEDALGDLEDEEGAEETDLFGEEEDMFGEGDDEFGEGEGDDDLMGFFDEGEEGEGELQDQEGEENLDDFFADENETVETVDVMETNEEAKELAEMETAKEKGNIIDLEGKPTLTEEEKNKLSQGTIKDLLKKAVDTEINETAASELKVEVAETVVVEKKPVPKTTYKVRHGDTFDSVAKKLGYPVTFQAKLAFLEKNPKHFEGMTETEVGKLILPLRAGKTLKLPVKPFKRSWLYNRSGANIETYVIEFYESENEASAEVVCDSLIKKGIKAYIRPFGRTYQVMIGFFDNKTTAEKVIKENALYFGLNNDSINLLKLTRGRDSYDDYVARDREQYYIQIFASQDRNASQSVLKKAREIQVKSSALTEGKIKGKSLYKIRVGYFKSRFEAVVEAKFLKQKLPEVTDFFIRKGKM